MHLNQGQIGEIWTFYYILVGRVALQRMKMLLFKEFFYIK
jgi:hypothetical protein